MGGGKQQLPPQQAPVYSTAADVADSRTIDLLHSTDANRSTSPVVALVHTRDGNLLVALHGLNLLHHNQSILILTLTPTIIN
jgi:hypothetical protein